MKVLTLNKIHVHRRGAESAEVRVERTETKEVLHKVKPCQSLYISGLSAEMYHYTSLRPLRLCGELLQMRIKSNNIFGANMEAHR